MDDAEAKLIANALYQIRMILAAYVGADVDAPALHNEAAALAEGARFDISSALNKVAAMDGILGTADGSQLATLWDHATKTRT